MNKPNHVKYLGLVNSEKYIDFIEEHVSFSENNNYNREKYFSGCKNWFLVERSRINHPHIIQKFFDISQDITQILNSNYGNGSVYNIQFSLMPPGKKIASHYDTGLDFSLSHRIHLPITTNSDVRFYIEDCLFKFKQGQLVEINNKKIHYVENDSEISRVHLIVDYIPSMFLSYL